MVVVVLLRKIRRMAALHLQKLEFLKGCHLQVLLLSVSLFQVHCILVLMFNVVELLLGHVNVISSIYFQYFLFLFNYFSPY